jgi:hypothetical protein
MASDGDSRYSLKLRSKTSLTAVLDFKQERLSPSLAIYNGSIDFRLAFVLSKTSLA